MTMRTMADGSVSWESMQVGVASTAGDAEPLSAT